MDEADAVSLAQRLTDLPQQVEGPFRRHGAIAGFVSVKPDISYHFVTARNGGTVTNLADIGQTGLRINGGYFVFRREIFSYLRQGDDLVTGAFQRLLPLNRLLAYRYDGFWQSMDTFKDKQRLDEMYARGDAPWEVWKRTAPAETAVAGRLPLRLPRAGRRQLHSH